ncbi:Na/Pi cotransporter family protein [Myxococcota bacterium]|nr:Na/Pi cotransporter family protein [Myxococcota bacterium]MBU1430078.1 Na/Pi cotransporter family protein [Myxococcota bacterium]MBU1900666.1 Na/Pi cotransporter family protein [Myxococcota bacterium]
MIITLLGGLGLFLYGMSVMSEALQNVAGERLRGFLRKLTKNRFAGIFTGFAVTTIIQSSSATTVMLVGFVSAGLISLTQAIGVVMGANIGTTITGWLVALLGFKIDINMLALPAIGLGFFARFLKREQLTSWGGVLLGFGLLFLGLTFMKDSVGDLRKSQAVMEWLGSASVNGIGSYLLVVGIGAAVTMIIQSSSATMAVTMTLAQQGLIDFNTAAALIMGENIGTTITANLAAVGASASARQTARVHMLFNVAGVIWMMFFFFWFVEMIDALIPGQVFSADIEIRSAAIPDHMAAFHTIFNLINTILFIPLVDQLARVARWMVKDGETKGPKLRFLRSDLVATPELAVEEAHQTLHHMGRLAIEGFESFVTLICAPQGADLEGGARRIREIEDELDKFEEELAQFMIKTARAQISSKLSEEVSAIAGSAHDLERIGDHLEGLSRLISRKQQNRLDFTPDAIEDLQAMAADVRQLLATVVANIYEADPEILRRAWPIEVRIDQHRTRLRKKNIDRLKEGRCKVKSGVLFIEMLTSFERIGDHAFNIAQDFGPEGWVPDEQQAQSDEDDPSVELPASTCP